MFVRFAVWNLLWFYYSFFHMPCGADVDAGTDTLLQGQVLRDGEYLNSANKLFRLQFFSPVGVGLYANNNRYLGIFYNAKSSSYDKDPAWVANRDIPVPNLFVELKIDTGVLKIYYHGGGGVLVSNFSNSTNSLNASAIILDNGNLVLRAVDDRVLWQSFDHPTHALLPGMKLGVNYVTGHRWFLTSWMSDVVPAPGSFTLDLGGDHNGSSPSQLIVQWQGNANWTNGNIINRLLSFQSRDLNMSYIGNKTEKYFTYSRLNNVTFAKISLGSTGRITVHKEWKTGLTESESFFPCSIPYYPCGSQDLPKCRKGNERFNKRQGYVIYDNGLNYYRSTTSRSLFDCEVKCMQNCSCIAYASLHSNGTGCEIYDKTLWFKPANPNTDDTNFQNNINVIYFLDTGKGRKWWIGLVAGIGGVLTLLFICCCITKCKRFIENCSTSQEETPLHELGDVNELATGSTNAMSDETKLKMKANQIQIFSFKLLEMATDNFSTINKLGEGGFGSVYKGKLIGGQEIAIKRLSRSSGQGLTEFQNEILLIAKLQHDNLVKLLGCCTKGQEKILVYEYMPNKSLDFFLFDANKRELLKWTDRINIIEGVAQGLLYLHRFSRLKVIHRDLKASNILLDENMNPKISDFGMARIFGKQESEVNTNRIVGTYGYMSPEYAIKGVFSIKTYVFSFGVLLLEIVSGKRNYGSYDSRRPLNLIGLAWEFWVEGRAMEFVDSKLDGSNYENKIIRCVDVGLLCVQDEANDRPSMTEVISMLTNESTQLPKPKQPAFFIDISPHDASNGHSVKNPSANGLTISTTEGR